MQLKDIISKERYKERMQTCLKCEYYNPTFKQCKECGCFLILKAALSITQCPLGKWNEVKSESES